MRTFILTYEFQLKAGSAFKGWRTMTVSGNSVDALKLELVCIANDNGVNWSDIIVNSYNEI